MTGRDSPNVFTLWTVPDMDRVQQFLEREKPTSAVIAGGGFIGLEMAEALSRRGLAVTVDDVCGCVDACDIICCEKSMKRKRAKK